MPTREKTLALCFVEPGRVEMREMSLPAMGPEDVLVEVRVCGVCQFDLHVFRGDPHFRYPMFGGHEAVGVVVETGRAVTGLRPGQPVAVGGGPSPHFAHYMVCHQSSARPLPVPVERFEHWLVEPVSCAVNALDVLHIRPNDRVALIGCGFMGLLLVQGLRHSAAREIVATDLDAERVQLARRFGADRAFELSDPVQAEEFRGSAGPQGYDVVIEATGAQAALDLATLLVCQSGILCLFGLHWERPSFDGFRWHMRGLHVLNASPMCNPAVSNVFDGTPALMARSLYDLRPLVTHVVPAERAQELFETAVARKDRYLKGAVQFS